MEVIYGHSNYTQPLRALVATLNGLHVDGTLYIGYPIFSSVEETIAPDAMLTSPKHGLVLFTISATEPGPDTMAQLQDVQDRLYYAAQGNLSKYESLRDKRQLAVPIEVVTVFPEAPTVLLPFSAVGVSDTEALKNILDSLGPLHEKFEKPLNAAIQHVTFIRPAKKRENVRKENSRGAKLKTIEKEIANLDRWQKKAAIESPDGPQRIRGLAGSGKTIVLALKAAYLHAKNPDWRIAVTFYSRSLYQQFQELIRRFYFEQKNDEPDWSKLSVLHAWGASDIPGLYGELAQRCGEIPKNFLYARSTYGRRDAFQGVCNELLEACDKNEFQPIYDAVLIDEAQDLPWQFFRLVHAFTKPPKRVFWAYDELQTLSEESMPSMEALFGLDSNGDPLVQLVNEEGQPRQDLILEVCYRNTPWALTLAHALGLGIYKNGQLVQHFDDPNLWLEVGYSLRNGLLEPGQDVSLERSATSSPPFFRDLLDPKDAVTYHVFEDHQSEREWLVREIEKNLSEDELEPDDILVILPDAFTSKSRGSVIINTLARKGINAHLAGVTSDRESLFFANSIAIAHIYRSKGNEAPMVYILNADECYSGPELIKIRNILFTAVTRSRAWVRIAGVGNEMRSLAAEIQRVMDHSYHLDFRVPTPQQLNTMRRINRERTAGEKAKIKRAEKGLREFLDAMQRGDLTLESFPSDLRTQLVHLLNERDSAGDTEESL